MVWALGSTVEQVRSAFCVRAVSRCLDCVFVPEIRARQGCMYLILYACFKAFHVRLEVSTLRNLITGLGPGVFRCISTYRTLLICRFLL